jgi:5-(carboxyamino)imidazole ribonucleotide mutase
MSAHRTPALTIEYASGAESRGVEVVIAAAGGAAHLAGVVAAHTVLPVLGVPMESPSLKGMDSLLSTVQMPGEYPWAPWPSASRGRPTRRCSPWPSSPISARI